MKDKKALKTNLIFAGVLLAVALVLFAVLQLRPTGGTAVLTYGEDGQTMEIPLNKNARYDVDTGLYTIHLEVKDGAIAFVDSPCPDHLCEGYGWLSRQDDWAACLPAKANVVVMSEGKVVMEGTPRQVFSQVDELHRLRLDVPQVTELCCRLAEAGVDIPTDIINEEECAAALYELLK